jgi:signal transduction histidine kinase/ligand-binding sensor domain-containing protein
MIDFVHLVEVSENRRSPQHDGRQRKTEIHMVTVRCVPRNLVAILLLAAPAFALDPHKAITQLVHTAWTEQEGAPGYVEALAQTTDGYLWLGTRRGLYRFDGVRFTQFAASRDDDFPDPHIVALLATHDGALWIVTWSSRLFRLFNGNLTTWPKPAFTVAEAPDGSVLAGYNGLREFRNGVWKDKGKEWNFPGKLARRLFFDRTGVLWVAAEDRVLCHLPGQNRFVDPGEPVFYHPAWFQFAQAADSTVWLAETSRSAHTVKPPRPEDSSEDRYLPTEVRVGASKVLFDRNGSLWVGSLGDGLRRVAFPEKIRGQSISQFGREAEQFTKAQGLSADYVMSTLEDREGNIWWGTAGGLDRFREGAFAPVSTYHPQQGTLMVASKDGGLWIAASGTSEMWRIRPDGVQEEITGHERGYNLFLQTLFEDDSGILWLAGSHLWRRESSRLVKVPFPDTPLDITSMTRDHKGRLWLLDEKKGVLLFSNGALENLSSAAGIQPQSGILYTDRLGRVWIGLNGHVVLYRDGRFQTFGQKEGVPFGRVLAFHEDHAGDMWIAGDGGLSRFKNGRFHSLPRPNGFPARSAFGIAEDAKGDWWIASDTGALRINQGELSKAAEDSQYRVRYRSFDFLDGLSARREDLMSPLIRTADGLIWVATVAGLAVLDPKRIPMNTVPPPVQIEAVRVNGKPLATLDGIALPHERNNLEIDYTALSLSIPGRVLFRYKLEGADSDWHEAGTRRTAYFNDLKPRKYRFRVIARNNDGVWNEAGALLTFRIVPAFYQTLWFDLLCCGAGILALWGIYQMRLRQIAEGMNTRFDERLAERTQLASELHDTILQTVQATKMMADGALALHSEDPAILDQAMEKISAWLGEATEEGRTALNALRASATQSNDLAAAFQRTAQIAGTASAMRFVLSVEGSARDLHPIARDEIYRIGSEAIRNACLHSEGTALEVSLIYEQDLTVRVRDNGKGMDCDMAATGKPGHFGLQGMRERAARIRGSLHVVSRPGSGTQIELIVPGKAVFLECASGRRRVYEKLRDLLGGRKLSA